MKARLPRKSPTRFPSSSVNEATSRGFESGTLLFLDAPQALEGGQDADRAVEHPAVEDGVDVGAGHDGLSGAVEPAEDIARPVLAAGQAGLGDPAP